MHSWGMRTGGGKMAGKILLIQVEYMNTLITQSTLYYSAVDTIVWDHLMPWLLLLSTEHIFIKALLNAWHSGEKLQRKERGRKREKEKKRKKKNCLSNAALAGKMQFDTENNWRSLLKYCCVLPCFDNNLGRSLLLP